MKKILKKVTAAVMAAIMTVGIAASVNAEGDSGIATMADIDCKHPQVIKVFGGYEHKFTRVHHVKVSGTNEENVRWEECIIDEGVNNYYWECKFCGVTVSFSESIPVRKHSNSLCKGY